MTPDVVFVVASGYLGERDPVVCHSEDEAFSECVARWGSQTRANTVYLGNPVSARGIELWSADGRLPPLGRVVGPNGWKASVDAWDRRLRALRGDG